MKSVSWNTKKIIQIFLKKFRCIIVPKLFWWQKNRNGPILFINLTYVLDNWTWRTMLMENNNILCLKYRWIYFFDQLTFMTNKTCNIIPTIKYVSLSMCSATHVRFSFLFSLSNFHSFLGIKKVNAFIVVYFIYFPAQAHFYNENTIDGASKEILCVILIYCYFNLFWLDI